MLVIICDDCLRMDLKRKLGLVSGTGANQSYELIRSTQVTACFHHLKRRTSDQQPAVFFFLQPNSQMFLRVFLLSHVLQLSSVCIWRQIPWDYSVTDFGSQVLAWKVLANFTIFLASHIYELHTSFLLVWWSLFPLELEFGFVMKRVVGLVSGTIRESYELIRSIQVFPYS